MQRIFLRKQKPLEEDGIFCLLEKLTEELILNNLKWVEQRNVYSTEIRGMRTQAHLRGVLLGVGKASEVCLYELPRNLGPETPSA